MEQFDIKAIPDKSEKRELKKYYFRLAWIIITLVLIFSGMTRLMMFISAGIVSGDFSDAGISAGKKVIRSDPVMASLYSYGFPIIADIAAILTGILFTGSDIKKKLSRPNMSGKEFADTTVLTLGISTAASFLNLLLLAAILAASGKLSALTDDNLPKSVNMINKNNPLWLDILVFFYVCLLGPLLEEILFRGVVLEGLRKYGNSFGIIMSAVLFGLMHQNFVQCLPAISIGIIWAYADIKCGCIIPSVILHIINNSMSSILMLLMDTVDLSNLDDPAVIFGSAAPLFIVSFLFSLIRIVCLILSIVLFFKSLSAYPGGLIEKSEYSAHRTWKYMFTSPAWLAVIIYLTVSTFSSVSRLI